MKKIWLHKAGSFEEAGEFDRGYYINMNADERLEVMQQLREIYFKIKGRGNNANRKRLRRVIRII